jgi:putative CocE/NonD family hydrolase
MRLNVMSENKSSSLRFAFIIFFALSLIVPNSGAQEAEKISLFGEYKGYSEAPYDSYVRSSQYLTMRDGIKIAIDILRPTKDGKVAEEPLPVIWTHTRYRRAVIREGKVRSRADESMIKRGYILAVADVRGSGASFGSWQGIWTKEESQDAYEITEWLAAQPWCDGNIGMTGGSYLGITQLMAAGTNPPHLKAIFPAVALFDVYPVGFHGGVFYDDLIRHWSELTRIMDTESVAAPVDGDEDQTLLKEAVKEHLSSRSLLEIISPLRFRNSRDDVTGILPYYEWHPAAFVKEINQSRVPIYLWCGWFDSFTKDGFLMYRNFKNPRKMAIGASSHSPRDPEITRQTYAVAAVEQLRWFDYWLKGIDNGIMDEPPIMYHVMKSPKNNEWRSARQWPLPNEMPTRYFFHAGLSGSVRSTNDGKLTPEMPQPASGKDDYTVDYTTTTGEATRWDNAVGGEFEYPDMTQNDEKALTYTTDVLAEDVEVTGHPVVHLWISSTASDGDFFVYLEEVDAEGRSHYISEGTLKASHRALNQPYYDNLGLPFHRSHEEDIAELIPGEPVELAFDLQPTSNVFNAGNRIRITLTCADKDNASTPRLTPPPTVSVYREAGHASCIILPVISPGLEVEEFPTLLVAFIILGIVILVILFTNYMRRRMKR